MKGKKIFRKKTTVTMLLTVLMICSVCTVLPVVNSSNSIQTLIGISTEIESNEKEVNPNALIGPTYIAGFIKDGTQSGNIIEATAVVLVYYDKGIIRKDSGIIFGETIVFTPGILFFYSRKSVTIGDTFVIGRTRGFNIVD